MDKKYIFIGGMVVFIIIGCVLFLFGGKEIENSYNKKNKEVVANYVMYMEASFLLRLDVEEKYTECENEKCLRSFNVTYFELIDKNAKNYFKDVNLLKKKNVEDVLEEIIEVAVDKDKDFNKLKVYSDYKEIKSEINLDEEIKTEFIIDDKAELKLLLEGVDVEDDKKTTTTVDKFTSKKFNLGNEDVEFKNKKKNYKYSVDDDTRISVTAKGMASKLTKIKSVDLYVDVDDLSEGKKKIRVYVDYKGDDVNFTVSPSSISVSAFDTSKNEGNDDKEEPTTKPSDDDSSGSTVEKVGINLNDDVQYYELGACYKLVYIDDACLSLTIKDLKDKYPDYNKELDTTEYTDEDKFASDNIYSLTYYFPSCKLDISSSIKSKLDGVSGFVPSYNNASIEPSWIKFKDSQYNKYLEDINFAKYSLYPDNGCGDSGSGDISYKTLDEAICKKYNLTCDRW